MSTTTPDPSAGDIDYRLHCYGYANQRRTDPRIEARIHAAFGDARTIVNAAPTPPWT